MAVLSETMNEFAVRETVEQEHGNRETDFRNEVLEFVIPVSQKAC